jgi:23S rRNA (adenine2503-C2)-methyltransferase
MENFRQLNQSEILGQYLVARHVLRQKFPNAPNPNIVFMGQGEPLQNFLAVKNSVDIFLAPWAMELGPRQITLSSAGHLPGLMRWQEMGGINLAISVHNAIQEEREQLIPIAKQYPLKDLKNVLSQVKLRKRQFITLEYLLLKDVNHSSHHLEAFLDFCQGLPVIVNLIEFNPYPGAKFQRPEFQQVEAFKAGLVRAGIPAMKRTTKGDDVLAACGQLASQKSVEFAI